MSYHHIELARHDVLLAEGLPAESYLDTGDGALFTNGGGVRERHPASAALMWEAKGCAPIVVRGPTLTKVRRRLATRRSIGLSRVVERSDLASRHPATFVRTWQPEPRA